LVVVRLPPDMELLAASRALLSTKTPVLKPVVALAGDLICRAYAAVSINGRLVAIARDVDRHGRPLPRWQGCRRLSPSEIFLLARHPNSFDSRYYGALTLSAVCGIARPLIIF